MILDNEEEFYECKAPFIAVLSENHKEVLLNREEILNKVLKIKTLNDSFLERLKYEDCS